MRGSLVRASWLAGLFFIAQIFGVVSLLSEHTAHVAATELLPSRVSASSGNIPQGHHHHGDADGFIQHHELRGLTGILTCPSSRCEIALVCIADIDYVSRLRKWRSDPPRTPPKTDAVHRD